MKYVILTLCLIAVMVSPAFLASAKTPAPPPNYTMTCQEVLDQNGDTQYTRCENRDVVCYESQARSGAQCHYKFNGWWNQ